MKGLRLLVSHETTPVLVLEISPVYEGIKTHYITDGYQRHYVRN